MSSGAKSDARFGLGVVAAAFAVQALSIGLSLTAYPVFMASIEAEFGVGRTVTSFGIPVLLLAGALLAPWIGRRVDRGAARGVMASGALLMMSGLVGLSLAPGFASAAALWVLVVGAGHAMLGPLPAMTVLAKWFVARRGTMIAVAAMGTTFGGAIAPPLCEWLIGEFGWRTSVACLGVASAGLGLPIVYFGIVTSPAAIGAHPDGAREAPAASALEGGDDSVAVFFRDPGFWLVGVAFAVMNGVGISFLTHAVPIAGERGLEREEAVMVLTINAVAAACGKLLFGGLTDRFGVRNAARAAVVVQGLGWGGLLLSTGALSFVASAAVFSLGLGCMIPCQAGFIAGLFGMSRFGRASGLMGLVAILGAMVGPPLVGGAYETLGSYAVPLRFVAGATLLPFALFSAVRLQPAGRAPGSPLSMAASA